MRAYILKRLFLFPPTVALVTLVVFLIMAIIPGDAAIAILSGGEGRDGGVSQEDLDKLRHQLGLDRPVIVQYGDWLWGLVRGDLGDSLYYRVPVLDEIQERFLVTLELTIIAILIAGLLAVPIGVLSAVKQDTGFDYGIRMVTLTGIALPSFWVALLIVAALSYWFNWLPPLGYVNLWEKPFTNLEQLIFPALALAFTELAFTARMTRSSMLEVMRDDYMRTARAKGLREWVVIGRHALKNALLPVITVSGWQFGRLLGGAVVIEEIFVVPGIGRYLIDAINHRDYTVIQALMVMLATMILAINLITDLLYGWFNPRIRYGSSDV